MRQRHATRARVAELQREVAVPGRAAVSLADVMFHVGVIENWPVCHLQVEPIVTIASMEAANALREATGDSSQQLTRTSRKLRGSHALVRQRW